MTSSDDLNLDSQDLQDAFRRRDILEDKGQCFDDETLFGAAQGTISGAQLEAIIDHLRVCPECTLSWQVAHTLTQEDSDATDNVVAFSKAGSRRWFNPSSPLLATAAVVLLGVGISSVYLQSNQETAPVYRGGESGQERQRLNHSVVNGALQFSWAGVAARSATLNIYNENLELVYSTQELAPGQPVSPQSLSQDRVVFSISPESLPLLKAGQPFLWQIEVTLLDGQTQVSATQSETF